MDLDELMATLESPVVEGEVCGLPSDEEGDWYNDDDFHEALALLASARTALVAILLSTPDVDPSIALQGEGVAEDIGNFVSSFTDLEE